MLIARVVIVIWLMCWLGIVFSAQPPQAPPLESQRNSKDSPQFKAKAEKEANSTKLVSAAPLRSAADSVNTEGYKDAAHSDVEASEFWTIFGRRLKITDTFLATFTAFLFVATVFLYRATRDLVNGAEKTAEKQLRAYVMVTPMEPHCVTHFDTSHTVELALDVRNVGQTPAYELTTYSWMDIQPYPLPNDFRFSGPSSNSPTSKTTLPPGQMVRNTTGSARAPDQGVIDAVLRGELTIFVWGHTDYKDAFGHQRKTNFCFFASPASIRTKRVGYYHEHNDSD